MYQEYYFTVYELDCMLKWDGKKTQTQQTVPGV